MSASVLERLLSDDLQANAWRSRPRRPSVCSSGNGPRSRRFARGSGRERLRRGPLRLRRRAAERPARGTHFPHDETLAALAVACENLPSPFADAFLRELAEVRLAEMPLAPRVAREVLAQRTFPGGQSSRKAAAGPLGAPLPAEPAQPPGRWGKPSRADAPAPGGRDTREPPSAALGPSSHRVAKGFCYHANSANSRTAPRVLEKQGNHVIASARVGWGSAGDDENSSCTPPDALL